MRALPKTLLDLDLSDNPLKDKGIETVVKVFYGRNMLRGGVGSTAAADLLLSSDDEIDAEAKKKKEEMALKKIENLKGKGQVIAGEGDKLKEKHRNEEDDKFDPANLPILRKLVLQKCQISSKITLYREMRLNSLL